MNDDYVVDASILLTVMLDQPGNDRAVPYLWGAYISAVNLAEVVGKLQDLGSSDEKIELGLAKANLRVVPFDRDQAVIAGKLRTSTRRAGLSLGDRACLALAVTSGGKAVTLDRAWAGLDLPVEVIVAR